MSKALSAVNLDVREYKLCYIDLLISSDYGGETKEISVLRGTLVQSQGCCFSSKFLPFADAVP